MSVSVYPEQLRTILAFIESLDTAERRIIESLDTAERRIGEQGESVYPIFPKAVHLTDGEGSDWGVLRDEIGGEWHWEPPEHNTGRGLDS